MSLKLKRRWRQSWSMLGKHSNESSNRHLVVLEQTSYDKLVDDPGFEVRGYSKSNGWNIAEEDGDRINRNELIDFDADVVSTMHTILIYKTKS